MRDGEYGLIMPFMVCASQGGPFDDAAFVAGVSFGQHMTEVSVCPGATGWSAYVHPAMVPLYDLLAMRNGYVMSAEPWMEHPESSQHPAQHPDVSGAVDLFLQDEGGPHGRDA